MANTTRTKMFSYISLTFFLLSIISWIPYLVLNIQKPYGMLTFILSPIGFYFGYLAKSKLLALSNLAMLFSFVPVLIYVYLTKGYIPM